MSNGISVLILMGVIGACLGSFANVAALRTLSGEDWISQPSVCFHCGQKLRFFDNLPIFGFLRCGGRSSCCDQTLPRRYLYVELTMAGLLMLAWYQLDPAVLAAFVPFLTLMVVIFLTDMEAFIIPDWASLGGTGLGLVMALLFVPGVPRFGDAVFGGLAGFLLIYLINAAYKLWRGHDGMGFGDVKLMAMLGVWLGPASLLPILLGASLAGATVGIIATLTARCKNNSAGPAQLPFGCFLAPMALLWLFFAPQLMLAAH
ncbi:MAG TPA: hypothetical protein DCS39_02700 [Rhodobiaceae bacterium]|nr:hypothetical protein [Rhodobiaceae bacterium]